jgi:hypothetical protein
MTTFTLQDLTPAQQEAVKQHEAMLSAYNIVNTRSINNLPTTTEEDEAMEALSEKQFVEYGMNNPISASAIEYTHGGTLGAPAPQPSQVSPEALIDEMVAQLSISLKLLLTTIISQPKAQPEGAQVEENSSSNASLQETVGLVFEQSDWFKDMVKEEIESRVESEVEMYFERRFSPEDHFDFGDAVSNEVDDRLDDVVRDRLDEAVEEQLGEVVAERLKNIRVVFD